jgi:hypothetical protein
VEIDTRAPLHEVVDAARTHREHAHRPIADHSRRTLSNSGVRRRLWTTQERTPMARKVVVVSDLTGKEIDPKDAAVVTIRYADARRGQIVLDVNAGEVEELARKGTKQRRKGRRPKYLSPGVYIEEVSSGSRPIEGVGTSTAAFVGESPRKGRRS